jgi:hypothetical protein
MFLEATGYSDIPLHLFSYNWPEAGLRSRLNTEPGNKALRFANRDVLDWRATLFGCYI